MKNITIGIYGASGYGRECIPLIDKKTKDSAEIFFIDDNNNSVSINGYEILSYTQFLSIPGKKYCSVAIANSKVRQAISEKIISDSIIPINLKAENVIILDDVTLGDGFILNPFSCLTSNISIGKYFHANLYSYVAHDCIIGDYVTLAPGAKINGNVHIGDHTYVGTGAIIKQGSPEKPLTIGSGAVIGMGAVVTKSVPPGMVVVGNPARELSKN